MEAAKFWSLLRVGVDGCWRWPRAVGSGGYGSLKIGGRNGKQWRAHRYAYTLAKGNIPDGLFVCHTCDNGICCNPAHLWVGTLQDNHADMMRKGRGSKNAVHLRGQKHPLSKLTDFQRGNLKRLRGKGWSYRRLAAMYGISNQSAHEICKGKSYAYRKSRKPKAEELERIARRP